RGENGEGEENSGTPILPFPSPSCAVLCCAQVRWDSFTFFLSFFLSFFPVLCLSVPSIPLLLAALSPLFLPPSPTLSLFFSIIACLLSLWSFSLYSATSVFFISSSLCT